MVYQVRKVLFDVFLTFFFKPIINQTKCGTDPKCVVKSAVRNLQSAISFD